MRTVLAISSKGLLPERVLRLSLGAATSFASSPLTAAVAAQTLTTLQGLRDEAVVSFLNDAVTKGFSLQTVQSDFVLSVSVLIFKRMLESPAQWSPLLSSLLNHDVFSKDKFLLHISGRLDAYSTLYF